MRKRPRRTALPHNEDQVNGKNKRNKAKSDGSPDFFFWVRREKSGVRFRKHGTIFFLRGAKTKQAERLVWAGNPKSCNQSWGRA